MFVIELNQSHVRILPNICLSGALMETIYNGIRISLQGCGISYSSPVGALCRGLVLSYSLTDTRVLKQIMSNDHSFYSWRDKSTLIFHLVPSQIASIVTSPACKNTIRSSHFLLPSRACPSTVAASAHINNKSQNLQSNANMYHNAKPNVTLPASIL